MKREQMKVLFGPGGCFGIERALQIVALKTKHLGDADDELSESLARAPVISNADLLRIDIRMKHRGQHPTEGRTPRVIGWQVNLNLVSIPWGERFIADGHKPWHLDFEDVTIRRRALGAQQADHRVLRKFGANSVMVCIEAAETGLHKIQGETWDPRNPK